MPLLRGHRRRGVKSSIQLAFHSIIILFILFSGPTIRSDAGSILPDLVKLVKPGVVTIDVFDSDKVFLESGSGFFVTPELIVSSRHVFWKHHGSASSHASKRSRAHYAQAKTNDRRAPEEYSIQSVILDDTESDIILLKIDRPNSNQQSLALSNDILEEGEDIFVVSSPQGLEGVVSTGIVSALHNDIDVQISASIGKGSSGAPVFNYAGEVVAVVNGFLTSGQNMNFAIHANRLKFIMSHLITTGDSASKQLNAPPPPPPPPTLWQWVSLQEKAALRATGLNTSSPSANESGLFSIKKIFMDFHDFTSQVLWGGDAKSKSATTTTTTTQDKSELDSLFRNNNTRSLALRPIGEIVKSDPAAAAGTQEGTCSSSQPHAPASTTLSTSPRVEDDDTADKG